MARSGLAARGPGALPFFCQAFYPLSPHPGGSVTAHAQPRAPPSGPRPLFPAAAQPRREPPGSLRLKKLRPSLPPAASALASGESPQRARGCLRRRGRLGAAARPRLPRTSRPWQGAVAAGSGSQPAPPPSPLPSPLPSVRLQLAHTPPHTPHTASRCRLSPLGRGWPGDSAAAGLCSAPRAASAGQGSGRLPADPPPSSSPYPGRADVRRSRPIPDAAAPQDEERRVVPGQARRDPGEEEESQGG